MKVTAKLQTFLSSVKILSCLFIILSGVWNIIKTKEVPADVHSPFAGSRLSKTEDFGSLALALYGCLWAYDGWNNLNFAIEEQKNAEQNLPRSLLIGIPLVATCYILVNLAFFSTLPYSQITGPQAVALAFGEVVLGGVGMVVIPLIVAVSGFGAGLASLYSASRLVFAAARGGQLPEALSGIHRDWHTPVMAILFQSCLSCVLVVVGGIEELIDAASTASWVFYGSVFLGLLVLRRTHSDQHRPFKVWTSLPVVMLVVAVFLVLLPLLDKPVPTLTAFGVISLGAPVYLCFVMTTPWKIRPSVLDRWSGAFSSYFNAAFNLESSLEPVVKS
jgi:L-type amino acid transporter 9